MPDDETGISDTDELMVWTSRSDSYVNKDGETVRGISNPKLGDGFARENEIEGVVFSFEGEKLLVTENAWQLRFIRKFPTRVGGNYGHHK